MPTKVAILYPTSVPWMARCLDGIRRFAQEHGHWHLFSSPPSLQGVGESALTLHSLRGWNGHGIIAATNDVDELRIARGMGIPVVNLAGGTAKSHGIPRVMINHFAAGRLAADHLLDRGLEHLAFFGWKDLWYSDQRRLGFVARAAESGVTCEIFLRTAREESGLSWTRRIAGPAEWLASLPGPSGVFAVHDYRSQLLVEACQEAALRIPEDIAVIGMDNDETICEHSVPTLTSVSRNSEKVGWEAAALLHRMMQGQPPPGHDLFIEPEGVISRQSTEMLYCSDPLTGRAVNYMRENLKQRFNIVAIADCLGVSKRNLETHFRESFGTSPHEFLTRLRVRQAQALMKLQPKRTQQSIAKECGFGTMPTFYSAFRRVTGQSPSTVDQEGGIAPRK